MRPGVHHADSRCPADGTGGDGGRGENAERAAAEISAVLAPGDGEGLAERAGPAAETPHRRGGESPPPSHELYARDRLEGPDEDRLGNLGLLRDHVHAVMHAVDEVHVGLSLIHI